MWTLLLLLLTPPDLTWLAGSWRADLPDGSVVEERWSPPAQGSLIGTNRTLKHGRMVAFEFLRIEPLDGQPTYLAQPGGRSPATPFTLAEAAPNHLVFRNPTHDFPKQIEYLRKDDTLIATISGEGGPPVIFTFRRVP